MPTSTSQIAARVARACQAKTRCTPPLNTSNQPTNTVTTIPAIGGTAMARMPARIIRTLSTIDQVKDFFSNVGTEAAATLITAPPARVSERQGLIIQTATAAPASAANVLELLRRKVLEELLDGLVELFDVLVRLLRQSIRRDSAPDELFAPTVKQIHHQRPDLVWVLRRNRFAESKPPMMPAPASAKSVIECFHGVALPRGNVSDQTYIRAFCHQLPSFGRERCIYSID